MRGVQQKAVLLLTCMQKLLRWLMLTFSVGAPLCASLKTHLRSTWLSISSSAIVLCALQLRAITMSLRALAAALARCRNTATRAAVVIGSQAGLHRGSAQGSRVGGNAQAASPRRFCELSAAALRRNHRSSQQRDGTTSPRGFTLTFVTTAACYALFDALAARSFFELGC